MNLSFPLLVITLIISASSIGISYGASFDSPLYQSQNGIDPTDIQCNENLVLVLRANGSPACVTETTADKLGWDIVKIFGIVDITPSAIEPTISQVNYEFPLSSKTMKTEISSEPISWYADFDVTISNLPKVGETAEITVTVTNLDELDVSTMFLNPYIYIDFSDNFEFVNNTSGKISKTLVLPVNATETLSATVKAVKPGMGHVGGAATQDYGYSYWMFVGEDETLLREDYYKLHPQIKTAAADVQLNADGTEIEPEPTGFPHPKEFDYVESPYEPEGGKITEEELREKLKEEGYSEEEIEEAVQEDFYPEASKQEFFFPQIAGIQLNGYLSTSTSPLAPITITRVADANACAWDYDFTLKQFLKIACDRTSKNGYYNIANIVKPSTNQDGNLDLFVSYSTNGLESTVYNAKTIGKRELGSLYQVIDTKDRWLNPTAPIRHNEVLDTSNLDTANKNRAFWITDALYDAHDFIDDEFSLDIEIVKVGWQYDKTVKVAFGLGEGAQYHRNTDTIYLDGKLDYKRDDDSNERWTIVHEYGHHSMDDVFRNYPDTDPNDDDTCSGNSNVTPRIPGHSITTTSNTGCAWTEGWADVLPSLMDDSENYPRNQNFDILFEEDRIQFTSDNYRNFPKIDDDSDHVGDISEGQVGAAIWDIYDRNVDSTYDYINGKQLDNLREGYRTIGEIFLKQPQNFEVFFNELESDVNPTLATDVMKLHYMDFVVNSPPVINNISNKFVDELKTLSFRVIANDPDDDDLTYSLTSKPSGASINTSGTFRWTPTESQVGTHSVTVKVSDGELDDTDTFRVTVYNVNHSPVATSHSRITVLQDDSTTFWLYGTDEDDDTLSFSIRNYPDDGTLSTNGMGQFDTSKQYRYTPDTGFSGSDSFSFRVNDGTVNSSTVTVNITVEPIIPITFTTSWNSYGEINVRFSESLTKQFVPSDFDLSVGTVDKVLNQPNSKTRFLQVSSIPDNTSVTVTFVGGDYNLGGNSRLDNGESDVTPRSPDTTPPVITTPPNQTFEATSTLTRLTTSDYGIAAAIDNVDSSVTVTSNAVISFPLGNTVITYTATDSSGNTSSTTQTITVQDTTAPSNEPPSNQTFEATGLLTPLDERNYNEPYVFDAVDKTALLSDNAPDFFPLGDTIITWIATDDSGNSSTSTTTITVHDTTAPSITTPLDQTFEATAINTPLDSTDYGIAIASDIVDDNVTVTSDAPDLFPLGHTEITWFASDHSGNSHFAKQSITIVDTTAPSITAPLDQTFEATAINTPLTTNDFGMATGSDIFKPVVITNNSTGIFSLGDTIITWTATDANNNINTVTQTITIQDTTDPSIVPPVNQTFEATTTFTPLNSTDYGVATASDIFPVTLTNDAPDAFPLGNTEITWLATDTSGNSHFAKQTITVQDTIAPVITLEGPSKLILELGVDSFKGYGATVSDNLPNYTGNVTVGGDTVDELVVGFYYITYDAPPDASGNIPTQVTRSVHVADTIPPQLIVPSNYTSEATAILTPLNSTDYGYAKVIDNNPDITIKNDAPSAFPLGDTIITWFGSDTSNGVSATQTITIQDTTPPVITSPTDITVQATGPHTLVNIGNATAADIFSVTINNDAPESFPIGETIVTYTATDSNGNVNTATQTILVEGGTPIIYTGEWMAKDILDMRFTADVTPYFERSDFTVSNGEILGFYTWYNDDARLIFLMENLPENESLTVTYVGDDLDVGDYTLYSGEKFVSTPNPSVSVNNSMSDNWLKMIEK